MGYVCRGRQGRTARGYPTRRVTHAAASECGAAALVGTARVAGSPGRAHKKGDSVVCGGGHWILREQSLREKNSAFGERPFVCCEMFCRSNKIEQDGTPHRNAERNAHGPHDTRVEHTSHVTRQRRASSRSSAAARRLAPAAFLLVARPGVPTPAVFPASARSSRAAIR